MADTSQATYEPVVKLPKPPKHLGKIAAEAWSTYGKELIDSSVLCVTDLAALEQFAIWWERFRLANNPHDAELVELILSWPTLSSDVQQQIMLLVG